MPKGYVIGRADVTNPAAWAEYAAAKKLRQGAGTIDLVVVEGAP